jgi:hypothetical protein
MAAVTPGLTPPRPPLLSLLGALHGLGGLLTLGLLFLFNGVVANDTRHPEGITLLLVGSALVLGGAAALGFAAARGLTRGYRYGAWFSTALVWGFPVALVVVKRGDAGVFAVLLLAAALTQGLLVLALRRGLLVTAPPGEALLLAKRTVVLALAVALFGWLAHGMAVAGVAHIEAAVLEDLRSFVSAEAAYSQSNGGLYEARIECLARPRECLPAGETLQPFLDAATLERLTLQHPSYWQFRLHTAGGSMESGPDAARRSRTSVRGFALQARPIQPGHAGVRSFCVDDTVRLCFNPDGREFAIREGRCPPPPECSDL